MKRLALVSLASLSLLYCSSKPTFAFTTRTVFSEQAQGIDGKPVDLEVWPGYPLTINFLKTQEVIKDVLLGDPSHFVYGAMAGSLCPPMESDRGECNNTGAKVIYIRQIDPPINFPNLPHSPDGSTQLKLITEGPEGQKEYQFKIILAKKGLPTYTSLKIRPDSEKPKPALLTSDNKEGEISLLKQQDKSTNLPPLQQTENLTNNSNYPKNRQALNSVNQVANRLSDTVETKDSQIKQPITIRATELDEATQNIVTPTKTVSSPAKAKLIPQSKFSYSPQSISDANAIVRGLVLAKQRGEIEYHSPIWLQTQHAIIVLRQGKTISEAAKIANLPEDLLKQLTNLGQVRPPSSIVTSNKPSPSIKNNNTKNLNNIDLAVQGLSVAVQKRQIIPFTTDWLKARKAIALLNQGKTKLEAANQAKISLLELQNLINLGR